MNLEVVRIEEKRMRGRRGTGAWCTREHEEAGDEGTRARSDGRLIETGRG